MIGEIACLAMLALVACTHGEVAIPVVGQPTPFYGAAGKKVTIEATATPTDLTLDETLLFTIAVKGLLNADDVQRPVLSQIEAFEQFHIEDEPSTVTATTGTRVFQYRLKPRSTKVKAIPEFVFPYYDPSIPQPADRPELPFRKARSQPISLNIRKTPPPPTAIVPLEIPEFAESLAPAGPATPGWLLWVGAAVPPLGVLVWLVAWRILNPEGARLARRHRSRAARHSIRTLHTLARSGAATPRAVVDCLANYLGHRYNLPGVFSTPLELEQQLREVQASPATIKDCLAFMKNADAVRFAPNPATSTDALIADAERMIRAQEGDA